MLKLFLLFALVLGNILFNAASINANIYSQLDYSIDHNNIIAQNTLIKRFTPDSLAIKKNIVSDSLSENKLSPDSSTVITEIDSIAGRADSIVVDTVLYTPLYQHGRYNLLDITHYKKIEKKDLLYKDYSEFPDILADELDAYPLHLGYFGHYNHFSMFGGMPSDVSFRFNGRPIDDLLYQTMNPSELQSEAYESIEIFTGSDAVIFSDNASSALVNLQEMRFDTKYPYTKLWYSQAGYEYISADLVFAQNFKKDWNFNFGIRRQSGKGMYENDSIDAWNVRAGLRWNPSNLVSISLTESFTNHGLNLNGGVDYEKSTEYYDPIAAQIYYSKLKERVWSHDITLCGSLFTSQDSSSAISTTAYFSYDNWSKYRSKDIRLFVVDTNGSIEHISRHYGISMKYEQHLLELFTMRFGAELSQNSLESSFYNDGADVVRFSAFGHGVLNIFNNISLSGGMRTTQFMGKTMFSTGIKAIIRFSDFTITADVSRSERMPAACEGFNLKNEEHLLALSELKWKHSATEINIGAFARHINSPINSIIQYNEINLPVNTTSDNGTSAQIIGSYTRVSTTVFERIHLELFAQTYKSFEEGNENDKYPLLYGGASIFYEMKFGASILRLGTKIFAETEKKGVQFIPFTRVYVDFPNESNTTFNGFEAFASAKLGDAYVKIGYRNIINQGYYFVPLYPAIDGNFRLSFSWAFMN